VLVMWKARHLPQRYGRLNVNGPNFRAISAIAIWASRGVA
jgi:hypothetical protein